jgi:hypothetical protein
MLDEPTLNNLSDILTMCDLAKFAQYMPADSAFKKRVQSAKTCLELTKPENPVDDKKGQNT